MKILYSIQATGNGHISRAMELLPHLQKFGTVDFFLSGENSSLTLDAPVKFRSKGLSLFYTCQGTLDYWKLAKTISVLRMNKDVKNLPVERYDLVLNDFDCITSLACYFKKVPSIQFGHQASFMSAKTPRPERINRIGEWVLKNYAKASQYVGLHFESYDDFILSPVIKEEIIKAEPSDHNYVTVYLPAYCDRVLLDILKPLDHEFQVFSREVKEEKKIGNIILIPVSKNAFNKSMINCSGIITGGGFETPAEALYLRKKIIAVPIRGQYEQQCNGAALKKLGVTVLDKIDTSFEAIFEKWIDDPEVPQVEYPHSTESIIEFLMSRVDKEVSDDIFTESPFVSDMFNLKSKVKS